MDNLTFISELVKSLSWPVSLICIVFLLKNEIRSLLEKVTHFKHKETEISFNSEGGIEKLSEKIEENQDVKTTNVKDYLETAKTSPKAAILEVYHEVESKLIEYLNIGRKSRLNKKNNVLTDLEKLFPPGTEAYENIGLINNFKDKILEYKSYEISYDRALEYILICKPILHKLDIAIEQKKCPQ